MRSVRLQLVTFALLCAASLAATATDAPSDDPLDDPTVQKTLRAMNDASTWYHPDLFGEFEGVRLYTQKKYAGALKYFQIGAFYADKFSQLSLGLMYLNGEGVAKDPLTAYAWLDVAAEREYPDFVRTRDRVKGTLSTDQLQRAQPIRDELMARYGDAVAKPRMAMQLAHGTMEIAGSHLGAFGNIVHRSVKTACRGTVVVGGQVLPESGCGSDAIYAQARWKPDEYFASRDAQWKATVTVGDIKPDGTPAQKPADSATDQH